MRSLVVALPLALLATAAFAHPEAPDGTYVCMMEQYLAGDIEVAGNTYKGPAFDGRYEGTYDFEVDDFDNIHWAARSAATPSPDTRSSPRASSAATMTITPASRCR